MPVIMLFHCFPPPSLRAFPDSHEFFFFFPKSAFFSFSSSAIFFLFSRLYLTYRVLYIRCCFHRRHEPFLHNIELLHICVRHIETTFASTSRHEESLQRPLFFSAIIVSMRDEWTEEAFYMLPYAMKAEMPFSRIHILSFETVWNRMRPFSHNTATHLLSPSFLLFLPSSSSFLSFPASFYT